MKNAKRQGRMSEETIRGKSGKTGSEWFRILDKAGASAWEHRQIAAFLRENEKVSPWWAQMLSVAYERERGIRQKFQKCDGRFSASASRTMNVPLSALFAAWAGEALRRKWLADADLEVTTTTKNKYFRAKWDGGGSRLSVGFYAKGTAKSQVAVVRGAFRPEESLFRCSLVCINGNRHAIPLARWPAVILRGAFRPEESLFALSLHRPRVPADTTARCHAESL